MESITLYFKEGSSDKVYRAELREENVGWMVTFAYGRRGLPLTAGSKTSRPVEYGEAKCIYDKLIREKVAKGYRSGEEEYPVRLVQKEHTGIHCQLLNPLDESQLERFLNDAAYWAQEKYDGRRLLIQKKDGHVIGINRLGFTVGIPEPLKVAAQELPLDFLMDGEVVGDILQAFDLLSLNGRDLRSQGYAERLLELMNLLASRPHPSIKLVQTACLPLQKRAMLDMVQLQNREGVVFKRLDAPYTEGRPASGGSQLKYKLCESASCIVGGINAKRSVRLEMLDGDRLVSVGNVTIPPNQAVPALGSVVECRYLYAFQGGSLSQPVYLGPREDVPNWGCSISQLKFKAEPLAA